MWGYSQWHNHQSRYHTSFLILGGIPVENEVSVGDTSVNTRTTPERNRTINATDWITSATPCGMPVNLTLLQHFSATITAEDHHFCHQKSITESRLIEHWRATNGGISVLFQVVSRWLPNSGTCICNIVICAYILMGVDRAVPVLPVDKTIKNYNYNDHFL